MSFKHVYHLTIIKKKCKGNYHHIIKFPYAYFQTVFTHLPLSEATNALIYIARS